MWGWWVLGGVAAATAAAVLVAARWRVDEAERARAADRFARRVDLALPPELLPVVAQRLVRRRRAQLVATALALVAGVAVAAWVYRAGQAPGPGAGQGPGPGQGTGEGPGMGQGLGIGAGLLVIVAVQQLALAGASLAAQAGDLAQRGRDAPRASHLPRPRLADYLSPLELWLARGLAATAVLAPLAIAATRPDRRGPLLGLAAACLGTWALIELTVRLVVRARPAATGPQSLAFDDALRAEAARRLLGTAGSLPLAVGLFVGLAVWTAAGMALSGLYGLGGLALGLLAERPAARTHYRRRLWPAARA